MGAVKNVILVGGAFLFGNYLIQAELDESKEEKISEYKATSQAESESFSKDFEKRGTVPLEELGADIVAYREAWGHCSVYAQTLASKQAFFPGPRKTKESSVKISFLKKQRDACLERTCTSNNICTEKEFREKAQIFRRMRMQWDNTHPKQFKPSQKLEWAIRHTNRVRKR